MLVHHTIRGKYDTHRACESAKPLCTLIDESIPGNKVSSRFVGKKSASVQSGTLFEDGIIKPEIRV